MCQLQRIHVLVDSACPVCKQREETVYHSMVSCCFASQCWEKLLGRSFTSATSSLVDWFTRCLNYCFKEKMSQKAIMS